MNEKEKKEFIQGKLIELQLLEKHSMELQNQMQQILNESQELAMLDESLSDLESVKNGKKMFSQLGSGVFLMAEVKDTKSILMNVGANVVVEKSVSEAKDMIKNQLKDLEEITDKMNDQFGKIAIQAELIQQDLINAQSTEKK